MIVVRAPFRLPLGGGGTDLPAYYSQHESTLITATINKYMYININKPTILNKIKINYTKVEIVELDQVNLIKHEIVREALKYLNIRCPLEISSMADLPAGTGMGSSSAYTVGLLKILNTMIRRDVSTQILAEEACKIEIDLIGKPIGKQDQFATAFGGIVQLDIDKSGNVTVTPLNLDEEIIHELENRFMMFYTNIERDANIILAEQSQKIAHPILKQEQASNSSLQAMHTIKAIGIQIKNELIKGYLDSIGNLMHEHWLVKKSISTKMSNPDIDRWYELARAHGAQGGKIMGAGGGGLFLFCVPQEKRKTLRSAMEQAGLRYMGFRFDFEGVKVLANV